MPVNRKFEHQESNPFDLVLTQPTFTYKIPKHITLKKPVVETTSIDMSRIKKDLLKTLIVSSGILFLEALLWWKLH